MGYEIIVMTSQGRVTLWLRGVIGCLGMHGPQEEPQATDSDGAMRRVVEVILPEDSGEIDVAV